MKAAVRLAEPKAGGGRGERLSGGSEAGRRCRPKSDTQRRRESARGRVAAAVYLGSAWSDAAQKRPRSKCVWASEGAERRRRGKRREQKGAAGRGTRGAGRDTAATATDPRRGRVANESANEPKAGGAKRRPTDHGATAPPTAEGEGTLIAPGQRSAAERRGGGARRAEGGQGERACGAPPIKQPSAPWPRGGAPQQPEANNYTSAPRDA